MPPIHTPDHRLRVFVSSTLGELAEERKFARAAIEQLHLTPVLFELGARPHPPRELYLAYLDQSDVFVGIYAESYGWVAPGAAISGIEDEYRAAAGKPKLIYIREPSSKRDVLLTALLDHIGSDGVSYRAFDTPSTLGSLLVEDLAVLISERFVRDTAPAARVHRLPAPVDRFIGRTELLARLQGMLADPSVRLLTLVGPGGVGKTRLALEIARRRASRFSDGAEIVMLASTGSASLVPMTIRTSLSIAERFDATPAEQISNYLATRELLLVIDNFEHVIDAAPLLTEILAAAPRLTMLVTSRERLRLTGEHTVFVAPLELPPSAATRTQLEDAEATQLFVTRAQGARHDFMPDEHELAVVGEIVRRLDGLPLAIELAAASIRMLDPTELLARLTRRLEVLADAPRDAPERQRTMRRAITWSYDLLDADERRLFDQLGVFAGGFALDSVEAVCGHAMQGPVLDALAGLVDRSLVQAVTRPRSGPRFMLLETVREFAIEQLAARPERPEIEQRHARHFFALTLDLEPGYEHGREIAMIARFSDELDNLRATFRWLLNHDELASATRLAMALWRFWWVANLFEEGMHTARAILRRPHLLNERDHANALFILGHLRFGLSDYDSAFPVVEQARERYEAAGDELGLALALVSLGLIGTAQGRDDARNEALIQRAVTIADTHGDIWIGAFARIASGLRLIAHNRPDQATTVLEQAVTQCRAMGTEILLSYALTYLAHAYASLGEDTAARAILSEALERAAALGSAEPVARVLVAAASLALEQRPHIAAELLGAAESVLRSIAAPLWVLDGAQACERETRNQLGDQPFDDHFGVGTNMTFDDAVQSGKDYLSNSPQLS